MYIDGIINERGRSDTCRIIRENPEENNIMKQILLIEDDLSLVSGLSFAVKKEG